MTMLLEATKEATKTHLLKFQGNPKKAKPLSWIAIVATFVGGIAFIPTAMMVATYVWRLLTCGC